MNAFEQSVDRLQSILDSVSDPKQYIESCITQNIAKLKYPAAFAQAKE